MLAFLLALLVFSLSSFSDVLLIESNGDKSLVLISGTNVERRRCPREVELDQARAVCNASIATVAEETFRQRQLSFAAVPSEYRDRQAYTRITQTIDRLERAIAENEAEEGAPQRLELLQGIRQRISDTKRRLFDPVEVQEVTDLEQGVHAAFATLQYGFAPLWRDEVTGIIMNQWDRRHRTHEQATRHCVGAWRLPTERDFPNYDFLRRFLVSEAGAGLGRGNSSLIWLQNTCRILWSNGDDLLVTPPYACTHSAITVYSICVKR